VGAGYGTEDEFRGQVQYEIRDFLGDGRRLQVNAKGSSLVQFLEGRLLQPHMFDPRSNLVLTGGVKREDQESFENQKLYVSPLLNYKWSESFSSHIGYNLETNRLLEVDLTRGALGPVDDENQEYYVASLVLGNILERVDNTLNPRKGWRFLQMSNGPASVWVRKWISLNWFSREGVTFPFGKTGFLQESSSGEAFKSWRTLAIFPYSSAFLRVDPRACAVIPTSGWVRWTGMAIPSEA